MVTVVEEEVVVVVVVVVWVGDPQGMSRLTRCDPIHQRQMQGLLSRGTESSDEETQTCRAQPGSTGKCSKVNNTNMTKYSSLVHGSTVICAVMSELVFK